MSSLVLTSGWYYICTSYCTPDNAPLIVNITIFEEHIQTKKQTIVKNSEEERNFIAELTNSIKKLNTEHITSKKDLEQVVQEFTHNTDKIWFKYSKIVNITKHSKSWWNNEYMRELEKYRLSRHLKDWKTFKKVVKKTKQEFFNVKIQEITGKNSSLWELINWVKKRKLPAIKAIKYNRQPCLELNNLWQALYESFNSAQY